MNRLALTIALLWPALAVGDWRDDLPADWLVAAEVRDLGQLEGALALLGEPFGYRPPPVKGLAEALLGSKLADRPWGVVVAAKKDGQPTPIVYVPTDDYDAFCEGVDADRAEDLAIATLQGFEIAVSPRGGWARVTLLDAANRIGAPDPDAGPPVLDAPVQVAVSTGGLGAASGLFAARRAVLVARLRRGPRPASLPASLAEAIDRFAPAAPVIGALAEQAEPIAIGFDASDEELRVLAEWPVATPVGVGRSARRLAAENLIARFDSSTTLPMPLLDLALAVVESSSGSLIEAPEFPQPQWDDFAQAARDLLARAGAASVVLLDPAADAPPAANQAVAFEWTGSPDELGDALALGVLRWNVLVETARARSPMRVAIEPLPAEGGWRLSLDVFAAAGREMPPEEQAILRAYYGYDERVHVDVLPDPAGGWLATMVPPEHRASVELESPDAAPRAAGSFDLGRWATWQERVDAIGMENAIGRKAPRPIGAAEPASLIIRANGSITAIARLPLTVYGAAAERWSDRADGD